jgi:hypothetical protein
MQWDSLQLMLFSLDRYLFIGYFLLLIVAIRLESKMSSVLITFTVVAVTNGVMTSLVPLLYSVATNEGIANKFIWYGTFCLLDAMAVYLLYKFHHLLKQHVSAVAELAGASFLLLASIQSVFFIEQYLLLSSHTKVLYQYGIPLINILLMPLLIILWLVQKNPVKQRIQGAI